MYGVIYIILRTKYIFLYRTMISITVASYIIRLDAMLRIIDRKKCIGGKRRTHACMHKDGRKRVAIIKSVVLEESTSLMWTKREQKERRIRRSLVEITRRNDSQMLTRDARSKRHFPSTVDFAR